MSATVKQVVHSTPGVANPTDLRTGPAGVLGPAVSMPVPVQEVPGSKIIVQDSPRQGPAKKEAPKANEADGNSPAKSKGTDQ